MPGRALSVNVGRPRQVSVRRGRPVMSAIGKAPVSGRVRVAGVNVDGDDQADRTVHGGPDKAVYAYAREDELWWAARLARDVVPGMFGENLTVEGVDVSGAVIGERWRDRDRAAAGLPAAAALLQARPEVRGSADAQAVRPGGPARRLPAHPRRGRARRRRRRRGLDRPEHGVTVAQVARAIMLDESGLETAAAAPELPASLLRWMLERAA